MEKLVLDKGTMSTKKDKGIIYYTDNKLDRLTREHMLQGLVQESLLKSGLPITSCSLKPMDFGNNTVLDRESGVVTMYHQILTALKASTNKYVFFCEADVIYHRSHFDFDPPRDDTFYYNTHVWRCHPHRNICITYDDIRSVSGICANRELAVQHYEKRLAHIYKKGFDKIPGKNPRWARAMGFEPGKSVTAGGFVYEHIAYWRAELPNVDIRHRLTMTADQLSLDRFKHKPTGWFSGTVDDVPGWDIKKMFEI